MTNLTTYLSQISKYPRRKPWTPIRGYFKWGVPGVTYLNGPIAHPWRVKYNRKGISVSVGLFATLREAQAAARAFLEEERND